MAALVQTKMSAADEVYGREMQAVETIQAKARQLILSGDADSFARLHASGELHANMVVQPHVRVGPGRLDGPWNVTALGFAARHKKLNVMRQLIDLGANVHEETRELHGMASLEAAAVGFDDGVELLLEKGCDFALGNSAAGGNGTTPVHAAASKGHLSTLRIFRTFGVCMTKADDMGMSPIFAANAYNHPGEYLKQH